MNRLKLLAAAALLGLGTYAGAATAGVDVRIGLGVPGTVYYDDWAPAYHEHHYYAPRPVYHYYDTWSTSRYYDHRPAYRHHRHYRDHHRHDRGRHHRSHHRDHDRDHRWSDSHRRRYRDRD